MRRLLRCGGGWIAGTTLLSGALCLLYRGAIAQTATGAGHGTVVGRVLCSDTNGPARFASVTLQPVVLAKPDVTPHDPNNREHEVSRVYQTGLDGTVVIPDVAPGDYYFVAEKPGYRTGTEITREQMQHPTEQIARRMAEILTPVHVTAGRATNVETRILRGASIAGTVRFDDGTAYGGATVSLLRRNAKGEWEEIHAGLLNGYGSTKTNDAGQFRLSGLPAGEYLLSSLIAIESITIDRMLNGEQEGWSSSTGYRVNVYAPDATRRRDAKPVKLEDGQAADGAEIEIPLSKLHAVSGRLAEEGTGRTVNAGKVSVVFADDGTELGSANVTAEDGGFHLAFVPEGSYAAKVTEARDVVRTQIPNEPGAVPPSHTDEKVVRTFGDATAPLIVNGEMTGVVLSVPAKTAKSTQ